MTQKPKTYVTIVLDKSGSMSGTRLQTIEGFNEQIQQIKENAKDQELYTSLVTFNGNVFEHFWCVKAEELKEATTEDYIPNGNTAMYDGIGYALNKLQKTVKDDEDTAYLVIIISDGEENSSQKFTSSAIREIIGGLQETKRWTFTYMGCNEKDLEQMAKEVNIPVSNMAKWSNASSGETKRSLSKARNKLGDYYACRSAGQVKAQCLYSEDLAVAADFTDAADPVDNTVIGAAPDLNQISSQVMPNVAAGPLQQPYVLKKTKTTMIPPPAGNSYFDTGKPVDWS